MRSKNQTGAVKSAPKKKNPVAGQGEGKASQSASNKKPRQPKKRESRPTAFPLSEEIQSVPLESIARIAAAFPDLEPAEAIAKAFTLLEFAAAGKLHSSKSWEEGLRLHNEWLKAFDESAKWSAALPKKLEGELLGFDEVLSTFMPRDKKVARLPLFRKFVAAFFEICAMDAAKKIAEWRKKGIPRSFYDKARLLFDAWRKKNRAEAKAKNLKQSKDS